MKRLLLLFFVVFAFFSSCTEKKYFIDDIPVLNFSVDTIHFDTVFTTMGTSTRELRVINSNKYWVKLDEISLASGSSIFRLNIDGVAGNTRTGVEIAPGDSIFIFIDARIDPNNTDNPVAINDSIIFAYNNTSQDINLLAWGQDINLIQGEEIQTTTWSGTKPYVIFNSMMVDTGQILTIEEGVRVLFHRGSTMYIAGTLIVEGSLENRVLFSSDRLEELYTDIPGQWEGMYFVNGSQGSIIENATIKNAVSAIHLGNIGTQDIPPDIFLKNCKIIHNSVTGISSLGASIEAENCVVTHCGFYSLYLALGGSYDFTHCSINSYWDYNIRTTPGVLISDYVEYDDIIHTAPIDHLVFSNSSITGVLKNEIGIFSLDGSVLNCNFSSCVLSVNPELEIWQSYDISGSVISSDPGYVSFLDYDLRPDTLSILIDIADPVISGAVSTDLRGYSRFEDSGPDIGAYERQVGESSDK